VGGMHKYRLSEASRLPLFKPSELRYLYDIEKRVRGIFAALEVAGKSDIPRMVQFDYPVTDRVPEYWKTLFNMMLHDWTQRNRTVTNRELTALADKLLELVGSWDEQSRHIFWALLHSRTDKEAKNRLKVRTLTVEKKRYEYMLALAAQVLLKHR
jgi:hypothetical protein